MWDLMPPLPAYLSKYYLAVAADFSWGTQKFIYFLGGVDNWLMLQNQRDNGSFRYFDPSNTPDPDAEYVSIIGGEREL
jgi:hypothetical protein